MNILFLSSFPIYKNKGGVQRVTSILAEQLIKLGHTIIYLATETGNFETIDGIPQYFLPFEGLAQKKENVDYTENLLKENLINCIINQAGIDVNIIELLIKIKTDNLKIYTVHHNCIACLQQNYRNIILGNDGLLSKMLKKFDYKIIWDALKYYNKVKYSHYFNKAIRITDKLILLSPAYEKELNTFVKSWPKEKVISIPNPESFETQTDCLKYKENRILYIGRIEYSQKQVDLLLKIWAKLHKNYPDWHFDIVGNGSKLEELKKLALDEKLERIVFHGYQPPTKYLEKAKIFTLTSAFEGYPMVLVESQSYGVVPVAFNSFSAIGDIISKDTGFIIPAFDIDAFVKKLQLLMDNDTLREKLAQNALVHSEIYGATKITQTWHQLLENK